MSLSNGILHNASQTHTHRPGWAGMKPRPNHPARYAGRQSCGSHGPNLFPPTVGHTADNAGKKPPAHPPYAGCHSCEYRNPACSSDCFQGSQPYELDSGLRRNDGYPACIYHSGECRKLSLNNLIVCMELSPYATQRIGNPYIPGPRPR